MTDPIKELARRLGATNDGERAAFRWLQKVGAIPAHHKPESSNIRLGVYSRQKDAIQTEATTKGIDPEMPFGVNTPDLIMVNEKMLYQATSLKQLKLIGSLILVGIQH